VRSARQLASAVTGRPGPTNADGMADGEMIETSEPAPRPTSAEVIASVPTELRRRYRALIDALRGGIGPNEWLEIIAGANSPQSGIVALTNARLMFFGPTGRLGQKVMCSTFARDDLRGARTDDQGVLVLRFMEAPIRFTQFMPPEAADLLARAIGGSPVDRFCAPDPEDDDETRAEREQMHPLRFRDELSARLPHGETLAAVHATSDRSGLLALTDKSLVWAWRPPSAPRTAAAMQGGQWDRGAPPWEAVRASPSEIQEALCRMHEVFRDWDALLEATSRLWFPGSTLFKASALTHKGLTDAALLVYDDAIREGRKMGIRLEYLARYRKAGLLIELGEIAQARRELARLYADDPNFEDYFGLLEKIKRPSIAVGREAIPEEVRHAVWRRDQGRCVQCGSQENLEFDHIIPLSRGGANTERNLQLLCESCNRQKGAAI
jgi:tetratricopeptide (TPR) repeat protein